MRQRKNAWNTPLLDVIRYSLEQTKPNQTKQKKRPWQDNISCYRIIIIFIIIYHDLTSWIKSICHFWVLFFLLVSSYIIFWFGSDSVVDSKQWIFVDQNGRYGHHDGDNDLWFWNFIHFFSFLCHFISLIHYKDFFVFAGLNNNVLDFFFERIFFWKK